MKKVFIFSPLKRKKCKKCLYNKQSRNIFLYIFKKNIEKEKKKLAPFLIDVINMITTSPSCFKVKKFKYLKDNIIETPFIDKKSKNQLINIFSVSQRQYSNLRHFVHIYRFKKASFYDNKDDLRCTSLNSFPEKQKITILHKNKKYIFRLIDLASCWKSALTHQEDLFPYPIKLKNPYTNIIFTLTDLYNIYFKLEFSGLNTNFLIREFFKMGFNKNTFYTKFSHILKDISVKNYVFHANKQEKLEDLIDMCSKYFPEYEGEQKFKIKIKDEEKILKKMTPYLQLYYITEYSKNIMITKASKILLTVELKTFFNINRTLLKNFFDETTRPLRIIKSEKINKFLKMYSYT